MSTKATIIYGEDYHLYEEMMEGGELYLRLNGESVAFEASPAYIDVGIPNHVMEAILDNSDKIREILKFYKEKVPNDENW